MKVIEIHSQQEFDAVPKTFDELTELRIVSGVIVVKEAYNSARVVARGSARVVARGSAHVEAWESASVEARDSASVVARGSARVEAHDSSRVVARDSAHVVAWDSASVVAWESAHVEAWGSASVEAWDESVTITGLFFWSTLIMKFCVCKVGKKHKTAKIIKQARGVVSKKEFLRTLERSGSGYVLYKSVNPETLCDFQTGKIKYSGVVVCPDWTPDPSLECGGGLHLSPRPGMALSYHRGKVLRCRVLARDMVLYQPGDFTKVRCRKVEVLED